MDLAGDMDLAEDFVAYVVQRVARARAAASSRRSSATSALLERVQQAVSAHHLRRGDRRSCSSKGFAVEWGADFGADEETAISSSFDRPVLVHRYPIECKAFYMKADPADPRVALCVDMLAPEGYGEIIGGGQREDDLATLEAKIRAAQPAARTPSAGTSTCAATARCRTPASAWASSASSPGSAACRTCARRSPSRACWNGYGRRDVSPQSGWAAGPDRDIESCCSRRIRCWSQANFETEGTAGESDPARRRLTPGQRLAHKAPMRMHTLVVLVTLIGTRGARVTGSGSWMRTVLVWTSGRHAMCCVDQRPSSMRRCCRSGRWRGGAEYAWNRAGMDAMEPSDARDGGNGRIWRLRHRRGPLVDRDRGARHA